MQYLRGFRGIPTLAWFHSSQAVSQLVLVVALMITGRSTCCLLQAKRSLTLRTSDPWKSLERTLDAAGVCRAQPQRDQFSAGPLILLRTGPDQLLALVRTRLGPVPEGWCHLRLKSARKRDRVPGGFSCLRGACVRLVRWIPPHPS